MFPPDLLRRRFSGTVKHRSFRSYKKMKLYKGAKGDILKAKAYDLLKAAQSFIDKGVLQWR